MHKYAAFCTKHGKFCCVGTIVGLLMFLVVVGVIVGTAWIHLIKTKPMSTQGKEGNAVVLGRVNHFFIRNVDVHECVITEPHTVAVYRYDGDCDNLPANPSPQRIKHLKNITNMYLLKGTEFIYNLRLLHSNNTAHVDVYLTTGLEFGFNPHQFDEENVVCHNKAFFNGETHRCVHRVTTSTYYNLNMLVSSPVSNTEYDMNVSFDNKIIITSNLEYICTIANESDCVIDFSFSGSLACLVGNILNTSADDPFLNVDVNTITFQISPVLGITITVTVMILFLLVFCCCSTLSLLMHNFCV